MTIARCALLALAGALLLASACGGGGESFPKVVRLGDGDLFPTILNSHIAVGDRRVSLRIIDRDDAPVLGARVRLRFFELNGKTPRLTDETDATFVPVRLSFEDEQAGGRDTVVGDDGVYVAQTAFDEAGDWGVKVTVTRDAVTTEDIPFRFTVLERSPTPAIGDPAPASRQRVLADVAGVSEIDSSSPARPHMHDVTVADALRSAKPLVVAFATPAFCTSRTCAPVMDTVMDPLYAAYGDRATFIHIEPYDLPQLRETNARLPVMATQEWRLDTEPWVFVVGRDGRITAKFEGIAGRDEVERALIEAIREP